MKDCSANTLERKCLGQSTLAVGLCELQQRHASHTFSHLLGTLWKFSLVQLTVTSPWNVPDTLLCIFSICFFSCNYHSQAHAWQTSQPCPLRGFKKTTRGNRFQLALRQERSKPWKESSDSINKTSVGRQNNQMRTQGQVRV